MSSTSIENEQPQSQLQEQMQAQAQAQAQAQQQIQEQEKSGKGIHIKDALAILSSRAQSGGEKGALVAATPELKKLGQTLDLMNSQKWTMGEDGPRAAAAGSMMDPCCGGGLAEDANAGESKNDVGVDVDVDVDADANADTGTNDEDDASPKHQLPITGTDASAHTSNNSSANESDRKSQEEPSKLELELSTQSHPQLLSTLFKLQKERVAVYNEFNSGLDIVLQSGNLTTYPHLTTNITASFTVIAKSIKIMQGLFQKGDQMEIAGFIQQLQNLEKEKLNLTAALHLEKIRERNEALGVETSQSSSQGNQSNAGADDHGGNDAVVLDGDERILTLLRKSVVDLEKKIASFEEEINEVLEELRYAAYDLEQ